MIRDNTVIAGAAGVTIGSETSGGIRDIEVDGLKVMARGPAGILFKSASTRGGTIENIRIRNVEMTGVATPISVTLNWNPAYSYAKIPEGDEGLPRLLARARPSRCRPERGCRTSATCASPDVESHRRAARVSGEFVRRCAAGGFPVPGHRHRSPHRRLDRQRRTVDLHQRARSTRPTAASCAIPTSPSETPGPARE